MTLLCELATLLRGEPARHKAPSETTRFRSVWAALEVPAAPEPALQAA